MTTTLERKGGKVKLTAGNQAIVDEFKTVIRRHQDQARGELAHLFEIAFVVTLGAGESREDKLKRARVRGLDARLQLA